MKLLLSILLVFVVVVSSTLASKFTVAKVKRQTLWKRVSSDSPSSLQTTVTAASNAQDVNISSIQDLIYLVNINVGGHDYSVQLDTGSSDLFIKGDTYPIPNTNETSLMHNLTYALGWAYGHVAYAPVQFLGLSVTSQAFLDATSVDNPALSYGTQGICGLGFTRLSSIDLALNATQQSTGRNLLYNLFSVNHSEPNFIAFSLQRSTDPNDNAEGSFSIGEVDPQFANVSNSAPVPTWPVNSPVRWNILVDAVIANDTITVPTSSVVGAPTNKAVALIDSGASYSYVSKDITDAIYNQIPGAVFNDAIGYWILPCDAEVDMALQIGGQVYPLHPLDVNPATTLDSSTCIGSFVPQSASIASDVDWLLGDNVLRALYSVYNYGDFDASGEMGSPYMKFLSLVDPDQASIDFHNVRGGTPNTNITYTGLSGVANSLSFGLSDDTSQALEMIAKFIPATLGLVSLSAIVLIICCIIWLVSFCRKRKARATARLPLARNRSMRTMPQNDTNSYIAGMPLSPSGPLHTYEPVSMALSEDTFVPPSPAFRNSDGDSFRRGDRPKSFQSFS